VQRLDRRVQMFDLPPAELLTHDPRGQTIDGTLTVEAFVCWRIADYASNSGDVMNGTSVPMNFTLPANFGTLPASQRSLFVNQRRMTS
jgi:hypothetical protein